MTQLNIQQQLVREHASLIVAVVHACNNPNLQAPLREDLKIATQNGWGNLANAIELILKGELELENLGNLDPEDETIVIAILNALADPDLLPHPQQNSNPILAPAGMAGIIKEAAQGSENALRMLAMMDSDLARAKEEPLRQFGKILRRMLNGERHLPSLSMGLDARTTSLVQAILAELKKQGI